LNTNYEVIDKYYRLIVYLFVSQLGY